MVVLLPACCLNEDASLSEMLSWGNCAVALAWQAAVKVVAFWRSICARACRAALVGKSRGDGALMGHKSGLAITATTRRRQGARVCGSPFAGAARVRQLRARFEAAPATLASGTSREPEPEPTRRLRDRPYAVAEWYVGGDVSLVN